MPRIRVRQARMFLAACRSSSITGAARAISRSQTSVTKSLKDLERALEAELLDRSSKGVVLTAYGKALERGALRAAAEFEAARHLVAPVLLQKSPGIARFFHMDISEKWLDTFLATAEHQSLAAAADNLGVTAAAVAANVRKLEDLLSTPLFERLPNAMLPTTFARELIRHVKLARAHLGNAADEIASLRGIRCGRVSVGSLPFMRSLILPRAIARLRQRHSYIDISTTEGRYDDLVAALRCGDIDFLIGALRGPGLDASLDEETLLEDALSLVVRAGHPLLERAAVGWPDLLEYEWILPRRGTPTRTLFENEIGTRGLDSPPHVVETSSTVLLRGLLLEGDQVTVLSRHQIHYEEQYGILAVLPFPLPGTSRPIGLTRRAGSSLSPAAALLLDEVRTVATEVQTAL